ncbi:MAG TPA: hypothetical protein VIF35_13820 [Streptosporangiaceae bacterium]|jgi:hypothetical protein
MPAHRIGLVVPSSNVTVETELPALLGRQGGDREAGTYGRGPGARGGSRPALRPAAGRRARPPAR